MLTEKFEEITKKVTDNKGDSIIYACLGLAAIVVTCMYPAFTIGLLVGGLVGWNKEKIADLLKKG